MYFDANEACNSLNFNFGTQGLGATIPTSRQISIKVRQLDIDSLHDVEM